MEVFVIFIIDYPFCKEHGNVIFERIRLLQKSYNSSKSKSTMWATINFLYLIFFQFKIFNEFIFKLLTIVTLDQNKNMNMLYMKKMPKFVEDDQKKLLDGCNSTLEFFLVKHINFVFCIYLPLECK